MGGMADRETRTSGGTERKGGGGVDRVPEKQDVTNVKDLFKDKKQKELEVKWKKNIEFTKDAFKRKLVGGKEEHKRKLDEIGKTVDREIERIEKLPADRRKEALKKLREEQDKKINKLIEEVERESGRTDDEQAKGLAGREARTQVLWAKIERNDKLMGLLTGELNKRKPDLNVITNYNNEMVDNQLEIGGLIEGLEYKGPLQIREYWELEINSKIQLTERNTEAVTELKGIKNKVEVLKAQLSANPESVSVQQAGKLAGDIRLAKEAGLITETEAEDLKIQVAKAMTKAEAKVNLRKAEVPEEHKDKAMTRDEVADFRRRYKEAHIEKDSAIQKYYQMSGGDYDKMFEMIADPTGTHRVDMVKRLESITEDIDESVDLLHAASFIANGEYKRAKSTLKTFEKWRVAAESPMDPEVMLEGAKREIVKVALERIALEGPRAEIAVTNRDVKDWVMEQMNKVVSGGEESTSYSARQYLMDVAGILEKSDLHFDKTIEQMTDQIEGGQINLSPYRRNIEIGNEEVELLVRLRDGNHVDRANDDFRDEISATIIVHEIGNHYERSGGAEDMVRIQGAISTEQIPKVLKMESVGKEIKGKLGFYEVEMVKDKEDRETNRRRVLGRGEFNDSALGKEEIDRMHTAEVNKGFLNLVVYKDGREVEVIDASNFENLLSVEEDGVKITAGDVLDIMNQERFANPVLSRQTNIREKAEKEVVREAIMKNMGLVDIDGNINRERVIELLKARHGHGEGITFKLKNSRGEVVNLDHARAKMTMVKVGEKMMNYTGGQESRVKLEGGLEMALGGIREDRDSFGDMFNEYKMQYKLAQGVWNFTGLASAHWDKAFDGHTKDWHTKILHYIRYAQMYGIGPAHLRSHANLDYGDFITRRMKDINPELFGKQILTGKKGESFEFERKEIMKLVMKDRDGMFMSRQRFLDIYGRYKQLIDNGNGGEADEFLRDMLEEKMIYRFGKTKGKILMDKHWKDIKKIDWGGVIDGGLNGSEVPDGEKTGFVGLYWYMKQNYTYSNLKWGSGGQSADTTWGQRLYKEAQYLLSADKYRGAMLAWLTKNYNSPDAMIEAISAPGYYGQSDSNRKSQLLLRKWKEYMTTVGAGINPLATLETVKVDRDSNFAKIDEKKSAERWDGTLDYETETLGVGNCLAKRERKLKNPYSYSQVSEVIDQFARAGKLMPDAHHDIMGELVGFANPVDKLYHQIDKIPFGLGNLVKIPLYPLIGGFHWKDVKVFGVTLFKDWAPAGVLRWLLKKMWKWVTDTWEVRREIKQGAMQGLGESLKGTVKDVGGH